MDVEDHPVDDDMPRSRGWHLDEAYLSLRSAEAAYFQAESTESMIDVGVMYLSAIAHFMAADRVPSKVVPRPPH